jgi:Prokaryotic N-terminal methylation motif
MKLRTSHDRSQGFSLLEVNIAVALTLIGLTGCFAANANLLGMLKAANQGASASQSIQERVEQMRIANWLQITDSNYLKTALLSSPTASARSLPGCTETLTLTAYPPPVSGGGPSTRLTGSNGQVAIVSNDNALKDNPMVKADWVVTWTVAGNQSVRTRSGSVLVAKGGIVK